MFWARVKNWLFIKKGVNLLVVVLNCIDYWGGLKLRKLVIKNWVYVFPRAVSGDWGGVGESGGPLKWHVPVWRIFIGRFKCGKMGWPSKEEFLCKSFCVLSMCDGPMVTVGWIWVNIWCMLHWIFPQNCRNSLPLHRASWLNS